MTPPLPDADDVLRAAALLQLAAALEQALPAPPAGATLRIGAQLPLGPAGRVRCDLLLALAGRPDSRPAGLAAVLLVASVGDALRRDALLAAAAAGGVAEAWHLDPARGWLERYRAPHAGRYRLRELHWPGEGVPLPGGGGVVRLPAV